MTRPAAVFVFLAPILGSRRMRQPDEPNTERVIGRIDPSLSSRPVVSAPAEVRAGAEFTVTVTTVGFGCTSAEGGSVVVHDDLAGSCPTTAFPVRATMRFPRGPSRSSRVTSGHDATGRDCTPPRRRFPGLVAGSILDSIDIAISVLP